MRLEPILAGLFAACWLLLAAQALGLGLVSATLPLGLYDFYSLSAAVGWVAGNLFVGRARRISSPLRRRLLLLYLLGPPGLLLLVRQVAPLAERQGAPLVPVYGLAVFVVFFLVPVTLKRGQRS